jgi:hypothetical protein
VWLDWFFTTAIPTGATADIDAVLAEQSSVLDPYFDGATAVSGDFTYSWNGTANASTSKQTSPAVQGWATQWFGGNGGNGWTARSAGTGMSGGESIRKKWVIANTGASQDTGIRHTIAVTAGTTYTASIYQNSSVTTSLTSYVWWQDAGGATVSNTPTNNGVISTAGVWTRGSVTATAPAGAVTGNFIFGPYQGGMMAAAMPAGSTIDWDYCLIEQSPVLDTYFDGTVPGIENLAKTAPSSFNGLTQTTGVSYAGSTWTRGTVPAAGSSAMFRQFVALADLRQGERYTVSVTVANDQTTAQSIAMDWADTSGTPFTIQPGEVRRISVYGARILYDDVYRFADLNVIESATESRSILVKDWLIEIGNGIGAYYSGTGDFTYLWSGTVNASTSIQRAPNAQFWVAATTATSYQSTLAPVFGSKCGAVTTKGGNGDGVFVSNIAATAGTSYTWSTWIKTTSVHNLTGVMRWQDVNSTTIYDNVLDVTPSLVVGSWVRVSMTAVAPTNTTQVQPMWRIYAAHTPTTYYVDGVMMEASPALGTYFDGATAASGDFSYAWSGNGSANVNWSLQRTTLVPQTVASRNSGQLESKFFVYQSSAEDGSKTAKWLSPAGTGTSSWRIAGVSASNAALGWDWSKVKGGGTYTLFFRWRGSGWGAGQTFQTTIADGTSLNGVMNSSGAVILNTTGWQEFRQTFTALRDATTSSMTYHSLQATPQATTDGIFEIRDWMLVEGEYTGDFIIGSNPLSRWDGTANQSASVGYPPQLLDIAGAPMASTYTESSSLIPITGNPFDDCTVYLAYETYADLAEWTTIATVGGWTGSTTDWAAKGAFSFGRRNEGNLQYSHSRYGTSANSNQTAMGAMVIPGWKPSRHVVAISLTDGVTKMRTMMDGAAEVAINLQAGNGIAREFMKMRTGASSTEGTSSTVAKGLALYYYPGAHSTATRQAMSRYLGNKYGVVVA